LGKNGINTKTPRHKGRKKESGLDEVFKIPMKGRLPSFSEDILCGVVGSIPIL
jgi:hypothetical protein